MAGEIGPAVSTLVHELKKLQTAADGKPSLATLVREASRHQPPIKLAPSTISGWTSGRHVPKDLDDLLFVVRRYRAYAPASAVPGEDRWKDWHTAARNERARPTARAAAPSTAAPRTAADQTTAETGRRHRADAAKAARVMAVLPIHSGWLRRLREMPTLLRVPGDVNDALWHAHTVLRRDTVEFLDPDIAEAYRGLAGALEALCDELSALFDHFPDHPWVEVPPEWEWTMPDRYTGTARALEQARAVFVGQYDVWTNHLNRTGVLAPAAPADAAHAPAPAADPEVAAVARLLGVHAPQPRWTLVLTAARCTFATTAGWVIEDLLQADADARHHHPAEGRPGAGRARELQAAARALATAVTDAVPAADDPSQARSPWERAAPHLDDDALDELDRARRAFRTRHRDLARHLAQST